MTRAEKITALLERVRDGKTNACAEILKVFWDDDTVQHYAISAFGRILPHRRVNLDVEPRLLGQSFHPFEINGDLTSERIPFVFDDIDGDISAKFDFYGDAVRCELYYYYADVDLLESVWWGALQQASGGDQKGRVSCAAINGYASAQNILPSSTHPTDLCRFTWGGLFDNLEDLETNGCKYNRHLGGVTGALNPSTGLPFTNCPRNSKPQCYARLPDDYNGHPRYWGGIDFDTAPVITDANSGYSAISKGSKTLLKNSIRVIAGNKKVRSAPIYLFRKEINSGNPNSSYMRGLFEIGEGQIRGVYNTKLVPSGSNPQNVVLQSGFANQGGTGYGQSNYSSIAVLMVAAGPLNVSGQGSANHQIEFDAQGYTFVKVYTNPNTYSRVFSTNRIWWILEFYTHQRFGKRYSHSIFNIQSFIDAADWSVENVTFTDVEGEQFHHQRTDFHAVIDGRNADILITDLCRTGRVSIPFQSGGKYTIVPLKKVDDLETVKVFTDIGKDRNIIADNERTTVFTSRTPTAELINQVKVTYEDSSNDHVERPFTANDVELQFKAGRSLGSNSYHFNPLSLNAFGVTSRPEAAKFANSVLYFGQFDTGGAKNNCRVTFKTPLENVLDLKKYDVIKIESDEIDGKGYKNLRTGTFTPFYYFRIIKFSKDANNVVTVTTQAYNHVAYETFEVEHSTLPPEDVPEVLDASPVPAVIPPVSLGYSVNADYSDGYLQITVE